MDKDVQTTADDIRRLMDRLDGNIQESLAYVRGISDTWPDSEVNDVGRAVKAANQHLATLLADALTTHRAVRALAETVKTLSERLDGLEDRVHRLTE